MRKIMMLFVCAAQMLLAGEISRAQASGSDSLASLVNINQISLWALANGSIGVSPTGGDWGLFFPPMTAGLLYQDGLVWGGFVKDGHPPELRAGGQYFYSGTRPGAILETGQPENPDDPNVRLWRIRRDWQTADLTRDVAEFFHVPLASVTGEMTDSLRNRYQKDWDEWPWQKGAPFYDRNASGVMDAGEEPGFLDADQVLWFVVNDLDTARTKRLFGSPPIGLELQITLWAYRGSKESEIGKALRNTVFKRYRLIYKGRTDTPDTAHIDSMFVGQYAEPDIGDYADDFAGCDTTLQLGFAYNSSNSDAAYQPFSLVPPALGYSLLFGPATATGNPADRAIVNFGYRSGMKNLPMTFFWHKPTGVTYIDPEQGHANYDGTQQLYSLLNGLMPVNNMPFLDNNGKPVRFMVSGDPIKGTGWVDGMLHPPGNRRFLMVTGPFSMALHDTQDVVLAIVAGLGSDYLASVSVMKHFVELIRFYASNAFITGVKGDFATEPAPLPATFQLLPNMPNPFWDFTAISYRLHTQKYVRLSVYNLLGQRVRALANEMQFPANYRLLWNGTDDTGRRLPAGIYFLKLAVENRVQVHKMILAH